MEKHPIKDRFLAGRAALVTGGASGLGRAIALGLAGHGADVCIMSLSRQEARVVPSELKYYTNPREIEETRLQIEGLGVRSIALDGDISDATDVARAVARTVEQFGRLDILVNNAATDCVHPVHDHDDGAWLRVLTVNLYGPYLCTRAALPHMIAGGWGRVISIGSTNAHVGTAGYSAYAASKHGLLGFNRSLALEIAEQGITANTVSPGIVQTPSARMHIEKWARDEGVSFEAMRDRWMRAYPQKRFIEPEEVAALVCFLCREEARAINGEDVKVTTGAAY